jgi:hypothetical protein
MSDPLSIAKDIEESMLAFAADWKYIPTLPRGPQKERAILMLDYLLPDLQHIVAAHYISRGWRRHDDLAVVKPRRIIGGVFDDLVAYVPRDEPDTPVVIPRNPAPDPDPPMWSMKPVVNETFEERPPDD